MKVMDVADYIIKETNRIGYLIFNLELQKYIYFCNARSLIECDSPLFNDEKLSKWRYEPVSKIVYYEYKSYGMNNIKHPNSHFKFDENNFDFHIEEFNENDLVFETKQLISSTIKKINSLFGI